MWRMRRAAEVGLPMAGVIVVLAAVVLFPRSVGVRIALALLGIALIGAGVWGRGAPVLPSERKYVALRGEVDRFIVLVRRLNRATLALTGEPTPQNRARMLDVRDQMLESVKRMEQVAGKADEPAIDPVVPDPPRA